MAFPLVNAEGINASRQAGGIAPEPVPRPARPGSLINSAAINGWGINVSAQPADGLVPEVVKLSALINGAGINCTLLGGGGRAVSTQPPDPELPKNLVAPASPLIAGVLGIPQLQLGPKPDAQVFPIESLLPLTLGRPDVVFGQEAGDLALSAPSMEPVSLGVSIGMRGEPRKTAVRSCTARAASSA